MKTTLLTAIAALGLIAQSSAAINITSTKNFGNNNFGGSVTTSLSDTNSATAYTLSGSAVAKAIVLGTTSTVASANGSVTVRPDSSGQIKGKLVIKGIVRKDYTQNFVAALDFNPGTFSNTWSTGTKSFSIVGITLKASGKVSVSATAKAKAFVTTPLRVEAIITPTFDVSATATGSVTALGVTAGVEGSISILKVSLPISAILTPNVVLVDGQLSISGSKVEVKVTLAGTLTKGSLKAFVKVLGIKNSVTIATFNGVSFGPTTLTSGTFVLQ